MESCHMCPFMNGHNLHFDPSIYMKCYVISVMNFHAHCKVMTLPKEALHMRTGGVASTQPPDAHVALPCKQTLRTWHTHHLVMSMYNLCGNY